VNLALWDVTSGAVQTWGKCCDLPSGKCLHSELENHHF
jgi:hypothetical protein